MEQDILLPLPFPPQIHSKKPRGHLQKLHSQSFQQYLQRLKHMKKIQDENDHGYIGRQMAMSTYLIPYSDFIAHLLFPIRKPSYHQMDQSIKRCMTSWQANNNDKITKYIFSHLSYDFEILRDNELTDEQKVELIHLRHIVQQYLILTNSLSTLSANRILNIVHSLESPIDGIPPLPREKIINILYVLDYIIFKYDKLQRIQKQTLKQRQENKQDFINQIQYFPKYGINYNKAFKTFQQNKQKL